MSSGIFEKTFYETNAGEVVGIRVQPETLLLTLDGNTNDAPAGPITQQGSAKVSAGRRSIGINARLVRVKFVGAPPTGYKADSPIALPWLQEDTWETLSEFSTGTYLATPVEVVGKTAEKIR